MVKPRVENRLAHLRKSRGVSASDLAKSALAAKKSLAFRQSLIGKTLSVVTLDQGNALSGNYVKVKLVLSPQRPREANCIADIMIGGVTSDGVCERGSLPGII